MAIARKLQSEDVVIIDELAFKAPKTKEMAGILKALKLDGISTIVATAALDQNVYRSARNIDRVTVAPVAELNALAVLQPRKMLITRAGLDAIKQKAKAASGDRGEDKRGEDKRGEDKRGEDKTAASARGEGKAARGEGKSPTGGRKAPKK
jgi:large subunit ribosomal protein L4